MAESYESDHGRILLYCLERRGDAGRESHESHQGGGGAGNRSKAGKVPCLRKLFVAGRGHFRPLRVVPRPLLFSCLSCGSWLLEIQGWRLSTSQSRQATRDAFRKRTRRRSVERTRHSWLDSSNSMWLARRHERVPRVRKASMSVIRVRILVKWDMCALLLY